MRRSLLLAVFAALSAATASAQDQSAALFPGFDPGGTTRAWIKDAGAHWRVDWSPERGTPALIYGGQRPLVPAAQAGSDPALEQAARQGGDELAPARGFPSGTLELQQGKHLARLATARSRCN